MAAPSRFSSPPAASGLSASSLRGEAVAYLASGYRRMLSGGYVGALWGGMDYAPRLFNHGIGASARLDAYRAGLLGYLYSVRAPAAPAVPAPPDSAAYMESGSVSCGSYGPWPVDNPAPVPAWGSAYAVASSAEEAAEKGWLFRDESVPAGTPHPAFPAAASGGPALAAFMARASEPQPVPGPDPAFAYALPDPPPGAEPPPLSASAVSAMFRRPPGDPAAMTRCWLVGADAAVDPSTSPSFTYAAAARRDWSEWADDDAAEAAGDAFDGDVAANGGFVWSFSTDDATYSPDRETAFRCWLAGNGHASGNVRAYGAWSTVRVWTTSAPEGEGGQWLVRASADDPERGWDAWLDPFVIDGALGQPLNTEPASEYPYWRDSGASPDGLFDVAYAGGRPDPDSADPAALPSVPRTSGPLAMGTVVPKSSADDVAVQLAFTAVVTLVEDVVGDAASAGAVVGPGSSAPPWGGHTAISRARTWTVAGLVPGYGRWTREAGEDEGAFDGPSGAVFSSYGDLADFVESVVLPPTGIDPGALLAGSASWALSSPPGADYSVVQVRDGERGTSYPYVEYEFSGDLVTEARLTVDVRLAAGCIFESGYCA